MQITGARPIAGSAWAGPRPYLCVRYYVHLRWGAALDVRLVVRPYVLVHSADCAPCAGSARHPADAGGRAVRRRDGADFIDCLRHCAPTGAA